MRAKDSAAGLLLLAVAITGWAGTALGQTDPVAPKPPRPLPTLLGSTTTPVIVNRPGSLTESTPASTDNAIPVTPIGSPRGNSPYSTAPNRPDGIAPVSAATPVAPGTLPQNGYEMARPDSNKQGASKAVIAEEHSMAGASGTIPESVIGRQESSAVSLEWMGPANAKLGQVADYALVVRNVCAIPVQKVVVQVRLPGGVLVNSTDPQAAPDANNVMVWDLGTLMARQERSLKMKLQCQAKGDLMPQAWVTFTGSTVTRIRVREPKLALKVASAEKVLIGESTSIAMTVSNPGDGTTDLVKVHANLSPGLENVRGSKLDFEIGNLAAGESRTVQLLCVGKEGGKQMCDVIAEADGGLNAHDVCKIQIVAPRLELSMHGPSLKYLDRRAIYTIKVTNPGDAPATNVTVADVIPEGFKVLAASDSGRHDSSTRTVSWFVGEVGPGLSKEVKFEVQAVSMGEFKHQARATAARSIRAETAMATRVEGLSALLLELVDTEDPIEVGGDTAYELRVTNTGTKTENDIRLIATLPDRMELKDVKGPMRYKVEGKNIVFDPLETLSPRADVMVRINVKAMEQGNVRFKIQMTSGSLPEPVIKMEATRIYSDSNENEKSPTDKSASPSPLPGSINPASGVSDLPTMKPPTTPKVPMGPIMPTEPMDQPTPVTPPGSTQPMPPKVEGPGPAPLAPPGRN